MDIDYEDVNATTYLADLVRCENIKSNIKKLLQSNHGKEAVNTNLYPIGI